MDREKWSREEYEDWWHERGHWYGRPRFGYPPLWQYMARMLRGEA